MSKREKKIKPFHKKYPNGEIGLEFTDDDTYFYYDTRVWEIEPETKNKKEAE